MATETTECENCGTEFEYDPDTAAAKQGIQLDPSLCSSCTEGKAFAGMGTGEKNSDADRL